MPYVGEVTIVVSSSNDHKWKMKKQQIRGVREIRQIEDGGKLLRFFNIM